MATILRSKLELFSPGLQHCEGSALQRSSTIHEITRTNTNLVVSWVSCDFVDRTVLKIPSAQPPKRDRQNYRFTSRLTYNNKSTPGRSGYDPSEFRPESRRS